MKKLFSYMLIMIFSTSVFAQTKVIFDTDIGSDCDDAGAMDILHKLHDRGRTIAMVTHEPDIAAHTQRVICIRDGQVTSEGDCVPSH